MAWDTNQDVGRGDDGRRPTSVLWLHEHADPVASGELRRLGVPALAMRRDDWSSQFAHAATAAQWPPADMVVAPLAAVCAAPQLQGGAGTPLVVEADWATVASRPDAAAVLAGVGARLAGLVARGVRVAAWAERIIGARCPIWLIPDPAVRQVELTAAAMAAGLPRPYDPAALMPMVEDLWFAEPGDHVEPDEVAALCDVWSEDRAGRLVVAPPLIGAWLRQAGIRAEYLDWSPATLQRALSKARHCRFVGPSGYSQARRRVLALRSGAPAPAPESQPATAFDPAQVAAKWEEALSAVALAHPAHPPGRASKPLRVMVFLDLIQDLDPILPVLDAFRAAGDVAVQVAMSRWLERRSPRVLHEIRARGLPVAIHDRSLMVAGSEPSLQGLDAVMTVAESSLSAHAPSHALVKRVQAFGLPTFALQHGVENVGLHPVEGEGDAVIASDHLFVWFPADRTPATVPPSLRPRLAHVGRDRPAVCDLTQMGASFAAFDSVVAVFENLHWSRYDQIWRMQFLTDCTEFALMNPTRAVVLKPHHAGLWSVKNRHLIPQWPPNLVVADPTDAFWEPFTAGALVQLADAVITTPSTVALDAVQMGKPVAVGAYGLDLPIYSPLPLLHRAQDWADFMGEAGSIRDAGRRAAFLTRTALDGGAGDRIAAYVAAVIRAGRMRREASFRPRISA